MDYEQLRYVKSQVKLRGVKGTTGTQASFLTLFEGDAKKVKELERKVAGKLGYNEVFAVTGQTYPRKFDSIVVDLLSSIAQSAYKFANDLRLLQNLKEVEEPFEKKQIGSSAMAYKRNPMRSERICSLARYIISLASSPAITASTQWFERTLDDSANKRLVIPQAFMALDAVLNIYLNESSGMVVYPKVIAKRIGEEQPFMATETILMDAVKRGGDRQELHEKIREYSMQAGARVKEEGLNNNLIDLIKGDKAFRMGPEEIDALMDPKNFIGLADVQVSDFIAEVADPVLDLYEGKLSLHGNVSV